MNKPNMDQIGQVLAILDMDETIGPLPIQYVKETVEKALFSLRAEFEFRAVANMMELCSNETPAEKSIHTDNVLYAMKYYNYLKTPRG